MKRFLQFKAVSKVPEPSQVSGYLLKNASINSISNAIGMGLGLALDALVLSRFGFSVETDALFAAIAIPLLLGSSFEVLAPKVFLPIFASKLGSQGNIGNGASDFFSKTTSTVAVALLAASILNLALAGLLIPLQVPGSSSGAIVLATRLSLLFSWLIVIRGLSSLFRCLLFAQHRYLTASLDKVVTNSVALLVVVFLTPRLGIHAVALGLVLGALAQASMMAFQIINSGVRFHFILGFRDPEVISVLKRLMYPLGSHILSESKVFVENFLGSFLGGGSISAIRYASRIAEAILGSLLGGIVKSTLPVLSHFASTHKPEVMKQTIVRSTKALVFIGTIACVWLVFVSGPLLALLFERGRFSEANTALVALLVGILAPGLVLGRLSATLQLSFFAHYDTKTPFLATLWFILVYLPLSILFVRLFGIVGLAVSFPISSAVPLFFIQRAHQQRYGRLEWQSSKRFFLSLAGSCLCSALGLHLGTWLNEWTQLEAPIHKIWALIIPATLGSLFFLVSGIALRLIQWSVITHMLKSALSSGRIEVTPKTTGSFSGQGEKPEDTSIPLA